MFEKKWNNKLSLVLLVAMMGLWAAHGARLIGLPEAVIGASIVMADRVVIYYFRKAPPPDDNT